MEEIIGILRAQLVLCKELLKLTEQQRIYLLERDQRGLTAIVSKEEDYMGKISLFERKKSKIFSDCQVEHISEFIDRAESSDAAVMVRRLVRQLDEILGQLKEKNQRNQAILQKNIDFIDFSVNVITQTAAEPVYGKKIDPLSPGVVSQKKMFDQNI